VVGVPAALADGRRRLDAPCERTPPAQRTASVADYAYNAALSPAVRAYSWGDGPYSSPPAQSQELASFARTVILHQPVDYEFANRAELGPDDQAFFHQLLFDPNTLATAAKNDLPYYGAHAFTENRSVMSFLFAYESDARVTGPLMAALMLLSLFALLAPVGRPRQIARLMFVTAWVALILPPATHQWDARYTIPTLGPLTTVATIGGWQLARLARGAKRRKTAS
jgi:hypothetical protein